MLCFAPGMIVGLTLAAVAFHRTCSYSHCNRLRPVFTHNSLILVTTEAGNVLVYGQRYSQVWFAIVPLFMIFFVLSHASGLGNVSWQQGELFGLEGAYTMTSLCPSLVSPALSVDLLFTSSDTLSPASSFQSVASGLPSQQPPIGVPT